VTTTRQTFEAIYDGEVLRPQQPVDLEPNTRYRVTIEVSPTEEVAEERAVESGPFDRILALAQDLGVPDLAEHHDHYLYGTPKR